MQPDSSTRDKARLYDKQQDPRRENGAVNMNQQVWQRCVEQSRQIVAAGKTKEDDGEYNQSHAGKEKALGPHVGLRSLCPRSC